MFDRLNERLKQADRQGEVYIVVGAMMALAHDAKRVTEDIDSHIRRDRDAVTRAVVKIADDGRRGSEQALAERGSDHELPVRRSRLGRAARLRQLAPDNRGSLGQPDARHELHAGRPPDLGRPRHPPAGGGVETRREAVRLCELTYSTEPMAVEADLAPDQAVRTAARPGHRAVTMNSHNTAALDADQEERSADVVRGGRHEPAELVLGRLEARMAESGLRVHIYLTERTIVEFATRRKRTDSAAGTQRRAGAGQARAR